MTTPLLVREKDAAASLGISRPTFRRWIAKGRISEGFMIDGCRLWQWDELEAFAKALAG